MRAPVALVAFAVLVATLGPRLLHRSGWPDRSPRVGILAWQTLTGSVVLAVVLAGSALAVPVVPLSVDLAELFSACAEALRTRYATPGGAALSITGAVIAAVVVARAGYCLVAGLVTAGRERRRQLQTLTLIARRHEECDALVVDSLAAAAYCLPGRRRAVVFTTAAVAALDKDQFAAVLAHERAHLRGRHDLVLATAAALQRAFPWVPAFRDARGELARLVEMLADDVATRSNGRLAVAAALVRLAEASTPAAALGAGGSASAARVCRLVAPAQPLSAARLGLAGLAMTALLATPVTLLVAPAVVIATAHLCPIDFPGSH